MLMWDYVKCCIRTESISFAIKQKREKVQELQRLNSCLTMLEPCICTCPNMNLIEELDSVKKEMENIYIEKARGRIVRSRCQFINEFEKQFFNMEKSNYNIKHIRALKVNGKQILGSADILKAQKDYFSKIYSQKKEVRLLTDSYEQFLLKQNLLQISEYTNNLCESKISLDELHKAVKDLASNKTPGSDGLPGEFYKFSWNDISYLVLQSFEDAFSTGQLSPSQRQGKNPYSQKRKKN